VLRDDRRKKDEALKRPTANPEEVAEKTSRNLILGCIVFIDNQTQRSKQFAFVDFSTKEAAKLCREAWHEGRMTKYPNRLQVAEYNSTHIKMTKEERDRTKER
jgi:RNA recognition motif-containing protein